MQEKPERALVIYFSLAEVRWWPKVNQARPKWPESCTYSSAYTQIYCKMMKLCQFKVFKHNSDQSLADH